MGRYFSDVMSHCVILCFLPNLTMIISLDFFRYASSFRFSGDYVDDKDIDALGRRKTRIVAIDALCGPGMRQYREKFLLRFVNLLFMWLLFFRIQIQYLFYLFIFQFFF